MKEDEIYIRRCIQLAKNGQNNVSPNPMVGAVIVCNGKIIGEGYHITYGGPHAEVNAIRSVKDESLLKRSTLYVSLEPCSHHGKTPPCADLIIEKQIPRVVIGCLDPYIKVAGRGVQKLRDAGREVVTGVLEEESLRLIRHFIVANTLRRPYIILKWAESADGFIDLHRTEGTAAKLSTDHTFMLAHKKRAEADAIMVGTNTAALDNPSLNVRHWYGKNPLRIVLDRHLALSRRLHLFDDSIPTLVYTTKTGQAGERTEYITLSGESPLLPQIMADLEQRRVQTLLVEGGSQLLQSFIDEGLWDEIFVEKSETLLLSGVKAPKVNLGNRCSIQKNFGVYTVIETRIY
jgi:diaminohydroxyphosphoribosylaminopyrimidine deaminase/5-amino-6-(5-phosphoribosylamino)uracil reductase